MNFVLPLNVNKKKKKTDFSELMQETSRTVCFFQHHMLQRVLGIRSLRDPVSPFNGVLTKPYCSVWSFQNHITSSSSRECIYMHTLLWKVCSDRKQKPCIICTNMTARFLFRSASNWIQKSPLSSWLYSLLSLFFFLMSLHLLSKFLKGQDAPKWFAWVETFSTHTDAFTSPKGNLHAV